MDMVQINRCDMITCAFNLNKVCHTPGINVGPHAECHTYIHGSAKGGFKEANGAIGACLASDCKYNDRLECVAPEISVAGHDIHADCETFEERS